MDDEPDVTTLADVSSEDTDEEGQEELPDGSWQLVREKRKSGNGCERAGTDDHATSDRWACFEARVLGLGARKYNVQCQVLAAFSSRAVMKVARKC
eukprot:scaffold20513_cov33-Tisochrysis_lutea.AAC.1